MSSPARTLLRLAAAASLIARGAHAVEPGTPGDSIGVVVHGCGTSLREVRELPDRLGVELAPHRFELGTAAPLVELGTSCTAVESVTFRDGATTRTRSVSLDDVAPALRPVALAVLTAEFLRSIWASPGATQARDSAPLSVSGDAVTASNVTAPTTEAQAPATAPPAANAAVPPSTKKTESPAAPATAPTADRGGGRSTPPAGAGLSIGAGGIMRYFTRPSTLLAGGELVADTPHFFVALNVVGGANSDRLGRVTLGVAAAAFGGRLPIFELNRATLSAVGVGELGYTWATASAPRAEIDSSSTGNFFASLTAGPELLLSPAHAFDLLLDARMGVSRGLRITGDQRDIAATQGFTICSTAQVRYTF